MQTKVSYASPGEALAARTSWDGECLVWTGHRIHNGYGRLGVGGVLTLAHRYVYAQAYGPIPAGLDIDHKCHNRACVRVEHLRAVSRKQNIENTSGPRTDNTSGYSNVVWVKSVGAWRVSIMHDGKTYYGGTCRLYELHVAAYKAMLLRNKYFTHNDLDRK